MIAGNEDASSF